MFLDVARVTPVKRQNAKVIQPFKGNVQRTTGAASVLNFPDLRNGMVWYGIFADHFPVFPAQFRFQCSQMRYRHFFSLSAPGVPSFGRTGADIRMLLMGSKSVPLGDRIVSDCQSQPRGSPCSRCLPGTPPTSAYRRSPRKNMRNKCHIHDRG